MLPLTHTTHATESQSIDDKAHTPIALVNGDEPSTRKSALRAVAAQIEPIALDIDQAAALIGVSRSMFYELMDAGKIGPMGVKFGPKCVRFPLAELRAWAEAGMPSREIWQRDRQSAGKIKGSKGS